MLGLSRDKISIACLAMGLVGFATDRTHAATILDFEGSGNDGGEALSNTNTVTSTTFGVTHGAQSLEVLNSGPNFTLFDIGTPTGSSSGATLAHYNAINAGLTETGPKYVSFDISIDTTNVTSFGYFQFTLTGNSQDGFTNDGYGSLINLYNFSNGLELGSAAISEGATLTLLGTSYNGVGTYHFTEPLFVGTTQTPGYDGVQFLLGNGGDSTTSAYYQISMNGSGNYSGTATFAIDNFAIGAASAPEPASFSLLGMSALAMLARRRKPR